MGPLVLFFLQLSAHAAGAQAYREHRYADAVTRFTEAIQTEAPNSAAYQESALMIGESLYLERKFGEAMPWFEKAAAGGPRTLAAQYMLGNSALQSHQDAAAVSAFATLFQVKPDSAAAHAVASGMMALQRMPADAEREARRALEIDPRFPQAHYILGDLALANTGAPVALAEFQKELALNPNFPMAFYQMGEAQAKTGAWDDAISSLERSIWLNPNHLGPYLLLGEAYLHQNNLSDAEGALKHVLSLDPNNARARALLDRAQKRPAEPAAPSAPPIKPQEARALSAYHAHDYASAAKMLEAELPAVPAQDPKYRDSLQMIGESEYLAGHIAAAIPWLEKARDAGLHGNELLYMLGNGYLQLREIPKGRAAIAGLFGVKPDSAAACLFTAQMLLHLEFEDEAQQEVDAALSREPKLPGAHFTAGEIAIARAQIDRAVEELHREIGLNPNYAMAYYRLGDAYTRREDWVHAIPPLQRAIWLDPTYSGPYILLGKAYFKTADLPDAETMLRRALQLDPRNSSAHYLLGRTLIQSGRPLEGKKMLQRSEELKPGATQ